jgi:hypothetical protein
LLPAALPEAWKDESSTAGAIAVALSQQRGMTLPWPLVRAAIDGALRARLIELTPDSLTWPCGYLVARTVKLRIPQNAPVTTSPTGVRVARAELRASQIQDLADVIPELARISAGQGLTFRIEIQLGGENPPPDIVITQINATLAAISADLKLE